MAQGEKMGERAQAMYEKSVDTMRGWFHGTQPDEAETALLEDEDVEQGTNGREKFSRKRRACEAVHPRKAFQLFCYILPSYFTRWFGQASEDSAIPAANSTSYLNGLRGVASVIVVFQHNLADFPFVFHGYGETENDHYFIQLPFVRLLTNGVFMVNVFFVISGFALSYGPLKKSYAGQSDAAIGSLPSSIFRRPFRLFLPCVPVLALTMFMINLQSFYSHHPPLPAGLFAQAGYLWQQLVRIMIVGDINSIMPQGWTLAAEFQGSLLVFMCTMAFARTSPKVRIPCALMICVFLFNLAMWQGCLFLAGMVLADIRHVRGRMPALTRGARVAVDVASWLLLLLALFLGGWPLNGDAFKTVGYSWFAWVPTGPLEPFRIFLGFSAVSLVVALENLPILQRGLNARAVLYLGEVSYGLYLVHWVVAKSGLTWGLKNRLLAVGHSLQFSAGLMFVVSVFLAFWVADVHWRLVDKRTVQFAHWLSKKCGV